MLERMSLHTGPEGFTDITSRVTELVKRKGRLVLGTWQGLYFCEFDGPRHRTCCVKVIGTS